MGLVTLLAAFSQVTAETESPEPESLPHFQVILSLIQQHLPGVTESDINRALVKGLLSGFGPRVTLRLADESPSSTGSGPWITRSGVYEQNVGYIRIAGVGAGLAEELSKLWEELRTNNSIEALVIDLRFAEGDDYHAAGYGADIFVRGDKALVSWDETVIRSSGRGGTFLPLAVLVNSETRGAAEALAGALRATGTALVIGSPTAGRAYVYRDFALDNWKLRMASLVVTVADGHSLAGGLRPDIETRLTLEKERAYFADPYALLPGEVAPARSNRPRMSEAELVRRRRGDTGTSAPLGGQGASAADGQPGIGDVQELRDPALLQAIDILKGILIVGPPSNTD